jgi:hypothetical protein
MTVRRILLSRFFIVPIAIAAVVAGWNIYVALHAHGLLTGRVVDRAGHSVVGATVILYTHDFVTQVEKTRTETDASGVFRFTDNNSHLIQLQALSGARSSPRVTIRLWFRAQDRAFKDPLVLAPPG